MAIYEYRCRKCGGAFEALQAMGSEPLEVCGEECVRHPQDGTGLVERQLSVANVHGSSSAAPQPPPGCGNCDSFDPSTCH